MRFLPPELIAGPPVLISKLAPVIGNRADGNRQSTSMTLDDAKKLVATNSPQQIEAKLAQKYKHPRELLAAHQMVSKAARLQASAAQGPAIKETVAEILAQYPNMHPSTAWCLAGRRHGVLN